ncbi:MAG TPA: ATP-binding protein [Steroidobacteraceae bacterium]|nr:ATP-binding protein [Steroidobacteraceae bacterium]
MSWRILLLLNFYRLLMSLVLGTLFLTLSPAPVGQVNSALFIAGLSAYTAFTIVAFSGIKGHWPGLHIQAIAHVLVDLIVISILTFTSGGMASGLPSLMVLPLTAVSLILSRRFAMLLAACATIGMLVQQLTSEFKAGSSADSTAAGLFGALCFFLAVSASYAARRMRESEALLKQREVDIANLAELNDFIVQHLRESILVVDAEDRVRLINESAAQHLKGGPIEPNTLLGEVSPRLLYLLDIWRRDTPEWHSTTLTLVSADGGTLIQPHFISLDSKDPGPTLVFLEDTSLIAERVQQSKLAALGRLSASIAHEIRNPVGAMSHAAQLLQESPAMDDQDRRLTNIITSNAERVSTIINNILQLSRRGSGQVERLALNKWIGDFSSQFIQSFELSSDQFTLEHPGYDVEVRVDPSHLQQILWNLCENALKYGRGKNDELILVRYGRTNNSNRPYLEVADRGPGISSEAAERIFEPFFTSGDGGTGLGLFIARELAHCNRAVLIYEPRHGGGSIFRIVFSDPLRWEI